MPFTPKQQPCGQVALQKSVQTPPTQVWTPVQGAQVPPPVPQAAFAVPGWQLPLSSQQPPGHCATQAPPEQHIPACAQETQIPVTQAVQPEQGGAQAVSHAPLRHCWPGAQQVLKDEDCETQGGSPVALQTQPGSGSSQFASGGQQASLFPQIVLPFVQQALSVLLKILRHTCPGEQQPNVGLVASPLPWFGQ